MKKLKQVVDDTKTGSYRMTVSSVSMKVWAVSLMFAPTLVAAQSVPIRGVESLTLQDWRQTTGRRSAPVNQMTCRGSNCKHAPSSIRCVNAGWDGVDVQWDCKAELDPSVRFGNMNVQCEGYEYPDDPNILAGSCGLVYTLVTTSPVAPSAITHGNHSSHPSESGGGGLLGSILMIGLICMGFSACGGGDDDDDYRSRNDSSSDFWTGVVAGALCATALSDDSYGDSYSSTSSGYASTSRR